MIVGKFSGRGHGLSGWGNPLVPYPINKSLGCQNQASWPKPMLNVAGTSVGFKEQTLSFNPPEA